MHKNIISQSLYTNKDTITIQRPPGKAYEPPWSAKLAGTGGGHFYKNFSRKDTVYERSVLHRVVQPVLILKAVSPAY